MERYLRPGSVPHVLDDGNLRYVYGVGRIAEIESDDTAHYYLSDALGSAMALTDASGGVENSYEYDVFGAVRSSSGSEPNTFTFAGEQADSTGMQYLRARYHDVSTGRFLSRDPLASSPSWPQHPFAYVGSSPTNFVDPLGLCLGLVKGSCIDRAREFGGKMLKESWKVGKQCAVWGVAGALVGGGTPASFLAGCAAGAATQLFNDYLKEHLPQPAQDAAGCGIWAIAAIKGGGSQPGAIGACAAGMGSMHPETGGGGNQCAAWGVGGAAGGKNLPIAAWSAAIGCLGGFAGDYVSHHGWWR